MAAKTHCTDVHTYNGVAAEDLLGNGAGQTPEHVPSAINNHSLLYRCTRGSDVKDLLLLYCTDCCIRRHVPSL